MFIALLCLAAALVLALLALTYTWQLLRKERRRSLRALQESEYMDAHDPLTGLANRNQLLRHLPLQIAHCRLRNRPLAIMLIGLDRFTPMNERLGLRAGDDILVEVSQRLQQLSPKPLVVARVSGDMFAVMFTHLRRRQLLLDLARRIQQEIQAPIQLSGRTVQVHCSIGLARYPQQGSSADNLLSKANVALAHAKLMGTASILSYQRGMEASDLHLLSLEPQLQQAIAADEFQVYLQPVYHTGTRRLVSFEALMRWQHPERGLLQPDHFLPQAEQLGLAVAIDHWMLRTCAAMIQRWRAAGVAVVPVAVNLSARQFQQSDLPRTMARLMHEFELQPGELELEITENTAMSDIQTGLNVLQQLRDMGIRVAIDDFGTGYSSLAYLRRLPIDKIKIDRSFVAEMQHSERDTTVVAKLIELSHALDKQIVAEGVETIAQFEALKSMGCDSVQGYLFSAPAEAEKSRGLLDHGWLSFGRAGFHFLPQPG